MDILCADCFGQPHNTYKSVSLNLLIGIWKIHGTTSVKHKRSREDVGFTVFVVQRYSRTSIGK